LLLRLRAKKGILEYTEEERVSTDLKGNPHSSIFSAVDTIGIGSFIKVVAWYDNEWGYSCRVADLLKFLGGKGRPGLLTKKGRGESCALFLFVIFLGIIVA